MHTRPSPPLPMGLPPPPLVPTAPLGGVSGRFTIQVSRGLEYLHSLKILHRDLKASNLFLRDGVVKIGDLGLARLLGPNSTTANSVVGTPQYISPELCHNAPYDDKCDVWSLGVITYQLCTLRLPFDGDNQAALILQILRCVYEPPPAIFSEPLHRFIGHCLQPEPGLRASASVLVEQCRDWLTGPSEPLVRPSNASVASANISDDASGRDGGAYNKTKRARAMRSLGSLAASLRKHAPRASRLPSMRHSASTNGRQTGTLASHGLPPEGRAHTRGRSGSLEVHAPMRHTHGRQTEAPLGERLSRAWSAEESLATQWGVSAEETLAPRPAPPPTSHPPARY